MHHVAQARGVSDEQVQTLVNQYTKGRQFGFLDKPIVNMLELNLALDGLKCLISMIGAAREQKNL